MAKFYGEIGYGTSVETPPGSGIWKDLIHEQPYYGDVVRDTRKLDKAEGLNDDISLGNSISIVADKYAIDNISAIRYVRWMGGLWTVPNVEVKAPRLILSIGRVYNGPTYQPPPGP